MKEILTLFFQNNRIKTQIIAFLNFDTIFSFYYTGIPYMIIFAIFCARKSLDAIAVAT